MGARYKEQEKDNRRRFKTCDHCHKETLTFVEGDSVSEDSLYWQSEHSSKKHPNSKPIVEIVAEWMTLRGITVEQLSGEVQKALDRQLEKIFQ